MSILSLRIGCKLPPCPTSKSRPTVMTVSSPSMYISSSSRANLKAEHPLLCVGRHGRSMTHEPIPGPGSVMRFHTSPGAYEYYPFTAPTALKSTKAPNKPTIRIPVLNDTRRTRMEDAVIFPPTISPTFDETPVGAERKIVGRDRSARGPIDFRDFGEILKEKQKEKANARETKREREDAENEDDDDPDSTRRQQRKHGGTDFVSLFDDLKTPGKNRENNPSGRRYHKDGRNFEPVFPGLSRSKAPLVDRSVLRANVLQRLGEMLTAKREKMARKRDRPQRDVKKRKEAVKDGKSLGSGSEEQ